MKKLEIRKYMDGKYEVGVYKEEQPGHWKRILGYRTDNANAVIRAASWFVEIEPVDELELIGPGGSHAVEEGTR